MAFRGPQAAAVVYLQPMTTSSILSPDDQRVTFVELFFDLVFVFSVTQVVGLLHTGITWPAVGRSVLVFWLVWWAWTQFTWALNAANTDHPRVQLATLAATGLAFFMAVAVPEAFAGGPIWFALPYVLVRTLGLVLYVGVAADAAHRSAITRFALLSTAGLVAVLAGAVAGGAAQLWLWGLAILLDVAAAGFAGRLEAWRLHPAHFVERHGLIVIIALGESLIVAAAGLVGAPRTPDLMAVSVLAVGTTCGLWWSYFPQVKPALERAMEQQREGQSAFARDVFSLAHFPMLCGVIGIAAAVEEAVAHADHALPIEGRAALAAGLALFLAGTAVARWRATCRVPWVRLVVVTVMAGGIVAAAVPPWTSLAIGLLAITIVVVTEQSADEPVGPRD